MKKSILFILVLLLGGAANAQTIFQDGFEDNFSAGWTFFNDENTPPSYYHNWDTTAWGIYESSGNPDRCAAGLSFFSPRGQADRWLITPAITLPEGMGAMLMFQAKSNLSSSPEWMEVRLCTTTPASRDDFMAQPLVVDTAVPNQWTDYGVSLAPYAGQTVYLAFVVKTNDGHSLLVDNVLVGHIPDNELILSSMHLPSAAALDREVGLLGTVESRGLQTLESFDVACVVNGTDTTRGTVSGLHLGYAASAQFSLPFPLSFSQNGTYEVQLILSNPNGQPDSDPSNNALSDSILVYNSSVLAERRILVEQFTGATCGWCPQGHDRIEQALEQVGAPHEWLVHHAGYYDDDLTVAASKQMTWFYGGSTYAPAYMVDRTNFSLGQADATPGPVDGVPYTTYVVDRLRQASEQPCFATIEMSDIHYDEATRKVTGRVSGQVGNELDAAGGRITIYVVEDSIVMTQTNNTGTVSPDPNYRHMNIVRGTVTGPWGDLLHVDPEGNYSYEIDYTLPAVAYLPTNGAPCNVPSRTRLVAMIYHYNSANLNDCQVWNSTSCPHFQAAHVGLSETQEEEAQALRIELYDLQGRLLKVENSQFSIFNSQFPTGVYLQRTVTTQGVSTKKISIVR